MSPGGKKRREQLFAWEYMWPTTETSSAFTTNASHLGVGPNNMLSLSRRQYEVCADQLKNYHTTNVATREKAVKGMEH